MELTSEVLKLALPSDWPKEIRRAGSKRPYLEAAFALALIISKCRERGSDYLTTTRVEIAVLLGTTPNTASRAITHLGEEGFLAVEFEGPYISDPVTIAPCWGRLSGAWAGWKPEEVCDA